MRCALEKGWTAATLIDDAELSESVGGGQHTFHNYSHRHYGPLRLREALGNSLNIPAVKTLKFVGQEAFLERLHSIGIVSLNQHPEFYGDGLALGNGEVSLVRDGPGLHRARPAGTLSAVDLGRE